MEESVTIMTVLQELRDFRTENNRRWEKNDKRWEENNRRWEENNKCWEENNRRWEENNRRWEENDKRWEENNRRWKQNEKILNSMDERLDSIHERLDLTNKRVSNLEEGRKKDKNEILDVLDAMQKSINKQFIDIRDYMDAQFKKINAIQTVNDMEHVEFKQLLKAYGIRIDLQSSRINYLEKWKKDNFGNDELITVY